MNKYTYARCFVKLAKLIAMATILLGSFFVITDIYLTKCKLDEKKFKISPELDLNTKAVQITYDNTQQRILESLNQSQFEPASKIQSIEISRLRNNINNIPPEEQPEQYISLANDLSKSTTEIKNYHKKEFDDAVRKLRDALLEYANNIKNQQVPQIVSTQQIQISSPVNNSNFRIFKDGLDNDRIRLDNLSNVLRHFIAIKEESKKASNVDAAERAIENLECIKKLIELQNDSPIASQEITNQAASYEPLLNSEKLAQRLLDDQKKVKISFYENWLLDQQVNEIDKLAKAEILKRDELKDQRNSITVNGVKSVFIKIICTFSLAFFFMVLADLITAFLNMSNNTDIFKAYASEGHDPESIS